MKIHELEPSSLPAPLSPYAEAQIRKDIKLLGISPAIMDGICGFRVIWRPLLPKPVNYKRSDGTTGTKRKSHKVRTKWFPIVQGVSEEQAFAEASLAAAAAYGMKPPKVRPRVSWEAMAKSQGVRIRQTYAKPALNGEMDRAAALFVQGYSPRQVADRIGIDRSTASRWRKKLGI